MEYQTPEGQEEATVEEMEIDGRLDRPDLKMYSRRHGTKKIIMQPTMRQASSSSGELPLNPNKKDLIWAKTVS